MNRKSLSLMAIVCAAGAATAQPVTYDFSGTLGDHFAPFIEEAGINSGQSAGVLWFDSGNLVTTTDPADAYVHTTFSPSYTESWTVSIEFDLPLVYDSNYTPSATDTQEVSLGIAAVFTAGDTTWNSIASSFEVYNPGTDFGTLERQYYADVVTNGVPSEVSGTENWSAAPGVSTGTLEISFDATTKIITARDVNGSIIIAADIDAPASDWGMTDTDTFQIGLFGAADNRAILTSSPISLDNFSGEIIAPDVTYDFAGVLGDNFSPLVDDPSILSQQAAGVLRIDTADADSGGDFIDIYAHNTFAPRFDESWTATIEFDLPLVYDSNYTPGTTEEQGVGLGIGAVFTDGATFFDGFAINIEVWSNGTINPNPRRQYYTSTFINEVDFPESETPAPGATSGSMTLIFDATTKVITATNGDGQILLSSDLDAPGSDLGMTDSDTFIVGIFGGATNRTIFTADPITLDNFSATITGGGEPPCLPDINGDGFVDNGDIGDFIDKFVVGDLSVDFNGDGLIDNGDIGDFIALFLAGC